MSSRMNKYYETEDSTPSRMKRNEDLYKEINKSELSSYDIKSNATVLGNNEPEIDVEKIKRILDTKYNEVQIKRRSIRLEQEDVKEDEKEETKEYDINVIIEKAKENKEDSYEDDRLRKLRDTQFDILNGLNLNNVDDKDSYKDNDLENLINTIALNEQKNESLDMLADLRGDDETEVFGAMQEDNEEVIDPEKEIAKVEEDLTKTSIINSFYTSSNLIDDKDFDDVDDFKELEADNNFVKIIVIIIIIALLVGAALVIKNKFF